MKVNTKIISAVKPLNEEVKQMIIIPNRMFWNDKVGQITCYVVVYDKKTQYLLRQEKEDKTYNNYFECYDDMLNLYYLHTLKCR